MEKFNKIYPFTTENIKGYMSDIDLTNKRVICVTGSTDHILNAILNGCMDITTFDINPLTKYYMELKLALCRKLSFKDFSNILFYNNLDINIINTLDMNSESKKFWINNYNNLELFNLKYYDIENKINSNMYLNQRNYDIIKNRLENVKIRYICSNLRDLDITEYYDYMFLSNISDYINCMFDDNYLNNYKELIFKFLKNVKKIYFAYVYDINNKVKRSEIDDLEKVKRVFGNIKVKKFKSAFITDKDLYDAVYIKEVD